MSSEIDVLESNDGKDAKRAVTKIFVRLKFFILGQNISETFYPALKLFVRSLKNARGNEKSDVWERFLRRCLSG